MITKLSCCNMHRSMCDRPSSLNQVDTTHARRTTPLLYRTGQPSRFAERLPSVKLVLWLALAMALDLLGQEGGTLC